MQVENFTPNTENMTLNENVRSTKNYKRSMTLVSFDESVGFSEPVVVSFFATKSNNYAVIHISHDKIYNSGCGKVTGSGYHKDSAALQHALVSAGVELDCNIAGTGEQNMVKALKAIAEYFKLKNYHIVDRG